MRNDLDNADGRLWGFFQAHPRVCLPLIRSPRLQSYEFPFASPRRVSRSDAPLALAPAYSDSHDIPLDFDMAPVCKQRGQ